ncbi:molybdenum cofactor guanylyltransferase MobA [Paracoccus sp. 2205BS29-5]|uniref:Molybdenum cofactor guanylyltransferase n=2 Tax=Paracoccus spongiarum TaxID=3064387 RepID=A0ABT9JDN4_9RHOB|nr:molybdenum cofactor guanylyltransferase MobA [Paracoccus sp. 2205BS29-5]MDP5307933.1 molybdenum cofactor guanylyltransferase MobA [Paracoccus sp. 2205BS29-5]
MDELPAIILAGGRARRMGGGDKGLLDIGGTAILARVIAALRSQAHPVAINANGDPARLAGFGLPVLGDGLPDQPGPLAGILAGLDWAARLGAPAVVSVAADMPFLPGDLVARLRASAPGIQAAMAAGRAANGSLRSHPTCALWPVALRADLRAQLVAGGRRLHDFALRHAAIPVVWDHAPIDPFFNVNTPADLEQASRLAGAGR